MDRPVEAATTDARPDVETSTRSDPGSETTTDDETIVVEDETTGGMTIDETGESPLSSRKEGKCQLKLTFVSPPVATETRTPTRETPEEAEATTTEEEDALEEDEMVETETPWARLSESPPSPREQSLSRSASDERPLGTSTPLGSNRSAGSRPR